MFRSRFRRRANALRFPFSTFVTRLAACAFALLLGTSAAIAADATGVVVDSSGRILPRAFVRVVDASGRELASGFADASGRFALNARGNCRVEASLAGFSTASVPCGDGALRVVLDVAPVSETVLVSATRTPAPASQVGASATVFTAEDLARRQQPLVADLLVGAPGAMLLRSGGPGTVTSLFVRGGESDYNKVLLDGVPLNESGGTYYLNNLTTENLDRVEFVRGAFSSLFGSDAMSSVVQLFTRHPDHPVRPTATAQIDGGTYGTLHATAGVTGATSRLDYSASAARFDSDNRVENSDLENDTLSGTAGLSLTSTTTLRVVGRTEREHVGTPGTTGFGRPDRDAFFERHDGIVSISVEQQTSRRLHQRGAYSFAGSNQQSTNLIADSPYLAHFEGRTGTFMTRDFTGDTLNESRRHHLTYQADLRVASRSTGGDHNLTVLADWDGERYTSTNRLVFAETRNTRNNAGVAVQEQMLWRRLFVTAGGRIEHNASFGTAFTPRGSVVFVAHQSAGSLGETRLKFSAGTGIKEPTMYESFNVTYGNPDLDPERSRSLEAGVEQRLAADRVKVEATYFDNHFTDVIQFKNVDPVTFAYQYRNGGETRARGLEFGGEAAPIDALRLRASYTLLDGKVLASADPSDSVFTVGSELFRRPRHSGSVEAIVHVRRLDASVSGSFIGRFVDSDFFLFDVPLTENPGHTLWNARASYVFTKQITGLLMIDNIGNSDYSEPFGYQPLLRTARAGVRVTF